MVTATAAACVRAWSWRSAPSVAAPFGQHPTFAQYLAWAQQQGCRVTTGYGYASNKRPYGVTKIVRVDGVVVIEATQHDEYLTPTAIARLDRRLDLQSPWFSPP